MAHSRLITAFGLSGGDESKIASVHEAVLVRIDLRILRYTTEPVVLRIWALHNRKHLLEGVVIDTGNGALIGLPWSVLSGAKITADTSVSFVRGRLGTSTSVETEHNLFNKNTLSFTSLVRLKQLKIPITYQVDQERPIMEIHLAEFDQRKGGDVTVRYPATFNLVQKTREMTSVKARVVRADNGEEWQPAVMVGTVQVLPPAKGVVAFTARED